jgi:hypothetical protein
MGQDSKPGGDAAARQAATLATIRQWSDDRHRVPTELVTFQRNMRAEVKRNEDRLLDRLAQAAGVDLDSLLEEPRRRNRAKRRAVNRLMEKVVADTKERAERARQRWAIERKEHLDRFRKYYAKRAGNPELKFLLPIEYWHSAPPSAGCTSLRCGADDYGEFVNTADMLVSDTHGIHLRPHLECLNRDCEDSEPVQTVQEITFMRSSPEHDMWIDEVSLDLSGSGFGAARLGDKVAGSSLAGPNPAFTHSHINVSLTVWQETPGRLRGPWTVLDRHPLWDQHGDYAEPILFERSTVAMSSRHVNVDGFGDDRGEYRLYCHLRLECQTKAMGTDGWSLMDFRGDHGIEVGCITLEGEAIR